MVGGLFKEKEKTEGARGKIALSSPLSVPAELGRRPAHRRRPSPAAQGTAAAAVRGKRAKGTRGFDPLPQFRERGPAGRGTTAMAVAAAMGSASRGGQG